MLKKLWSNGTVLAIGELCGYYAGIIALSVWLGNHVAGPLMIKILNGFMDAGEDET